ncbi:penicillin-binding protein [Candidatus Saccharibacteria bacterium]|nr:penicillin-binding protein [Candidatus Saccharibacteria bacterium]
MAKKKARSGFRVNSNLVGNPKKRRAPKSRRGKKRDALRRERATYKRALPKKWYKRWLRRLYPTTWLAYLKTRFGRRRILHIILGFFLAIIVFIVGLFLVFATELSKLSPEELAKRVASTVTVYYDRNGEILWEDKGTGDYRLVVDGDQISDYIRHATVALEDKDFYNHGGVSFSGIARAFINNFGGGGTQGGSTLTQQLVKQVFFIDEAQERGLAGVPRKIKEAVLSIEVENMYTKDQILNLYLNESPYGGRRNGVESAAQTYFGKSAKDVSLAEAALIASIPQNPSLYNPYYIIEACGTQEVSIDAENAEATETTTENISDRCTLTDNGLVQRQQTALTYMARAGYITEEEAAEAKLVPILSTVIPLKDQLTDVKAPHFVMMVKNELEDKLGVATVGRGGLQVTTSLDIRVQNILDNQMTELFNSYVPDSTGFDNASFTMVDNQTGQVLGLTGSRDYNYPDYGAVNSATSFIQPGSSIKPFVWAALINQQGEQTFGAGSVISDEPLPQSIYATGNGQSVRNADGRFKGSIPIRQSLGESRNIPVIKAMAFMGVEESIDAIRKEGNLSYCTDGADTFVGLSAAIGGCGVKQVEHANTFATLARGGTYRPVTGIVEVKDNEDNVVYEWEDKGEQVIDPQAAYIISDILHDPIARSGTLGSYPTGMYIRGIQTATKTGTTDTGGQAKDLWMNSYSTQAALSVWYGNHIPKALRQGSSLIPGSVVAEIMSATHNDIFINPENDKWGKYHWGGADDWFAQPQGIQRLSISGRSDIFPSWYNKNQRTLTKSTKVFDQISKKLATDCTPPAARVEKEVTSYYDIVTRKNTIKAEDGWDAENSDDVHSCSDISPSVSKNADGSADITYSPPTPPATNSGAIAFALAPGNHSISDITVTFNGVAYSCGCTVVGNGQYTMIVPSQFTGNVSITITVSDELLYQDSATGYINIPSAPPIGP